MQEDIIQLSGNQYGPTSMVLVGVHGDEIPGIVALQKLLPTLTIERGTVFFCYANPHAIRAGKRYTEANLNRMFVDGNVLSIEQKQSYEYSRAQFLKTYLNQADVLLDVHASSIPKSRTFVICESNADGIVEYLPVDLVVTGFDAVEPGGTDYYMNSIGKVGVCLETGYSNDPAAIDVAEKGIIAFLQARKHISGTPVQKTQEYVQMMKKYYAETDNFTLAQAFENFETVDAGELIGIDGDREIRAPKQSLILFAHNSDKSGEEIFLLGEKKNSLV